MKPGCKNSEITIDISDATIDTGLEINSNNILDIVPDSEEISSNSIPEIVHDSKENSSNSILEIAPDSKDIKSNYIREIVPHSKTQEIFLGNGETLPASFNVDYKDIKEGRKIGDGQWGPVHKPEWNGRAVAVKKFNKTSQNVALMSREVTLMLRFRHPNILKLLGFYLLAQDDRILKSTMIMELMDCDLGDYNTERTHPQQHDGEDCLPLSKDEALFIIAEIARGMNHMHKLGYFHRDLKPQNLLVRKSNVGFLHIKIADFGCSEFMGGTPPDQKVGTLRYKAPEHFNPSAKLLPDKVDVYSFAVLCCKIVTGNEPYGGHQCGMKEHIRNGGKPVIPDHDFPGDVAGLIKECLDTNPEARPDFQKICAILDPVMNGIWEVSAEKPLVPADSASTSSHIQDPNGFPIDAYFIYCDDIRLRRNIGGGGQSDIFQVQWKGCMYAGLVMLHHNQSKEKDGFAHQAQPQKHCDTQDFDMLIMELMQHDLKVLLDTKLREGEIKSTKFYLKYRIIPMLMWKNVRPFDEVRSRSIMKEIAQGMAYLHSKDVLHGDLKTTNVLVSKCTDGSLLVKLTDFGGGISFHPSLWAAPEALKARYDLHFASVSNRSLNSDKKMKVYNLGMVCSEMLCGNVPFDEHQKQLLYELRKVIIRGKRPRLPVKTSPDLKDLIEKCWHQDPAMDPTFLRFVSNYLSQ